MRPSDSILLREFALQGSESAFEELVRRYLGLVYSAAVRQLNGNSGLAGDICQSVFIDLARKARSLSEEVVLAAWLHRATRLATLAALRAEHRRAAREQSAVLMQQLNQPEPGLDWNALRPVMDETLDALSDRDREAVLLRYFQGLSLREVGTGLGLSENSARMRVERALHKLRDLLAKRGITTTGAALSLTLSANALQPVPAGLVVAVPSAALAAAITPANSTLQILQSMASAKLTLGMTVLAAAIVSIPILLQHQTVVRLRAENEELNQRLTAIPDASPQTVVPAQDADELQRLRAEHSELLRSRAEITRLKQQFTQAEQKAAAAAGANTLDEFHPVEKWANQGLGTPEAAVQTRLWAESRQDRESYLQSLAAPEGSPPETMDLVRNMLALKNWSEVANGFRLLAVNPISEGLVEVQTQTEWKDGRRNIGMEVLKRFGNEWKALVFSFPIDEKRSTWAFVHAGQLNSQGVFVNGLELDGGQPPSGE